MPSARATQAGSVVLVVDDDDDIREAVGESLRSEGYRTVEASNGREALDILRASPGRPDLILLDLMMPTMDGWEFLLHVNADADLREIPTALMSAHPSLRTGLVGDQEKLGFTRLLLPKPLDFARLLSFVRSVCSCAPA